MLAMFLSLLGFGQVGINMEDKDYINAVDPKPNPAVTFKAATSIIFDNAGNLYIAGRYGLVHRIKRGETKATMILDIQDEVAGYGDHGLLGLTLDKDFLANNRLYVYYVVDMYYYENFGKPGYDKNRSTDDVATIGRLTRYTLNPANDYKADPASRKILIGETLSTGIPIVTPSHAGGGLATGADGSILLGTGDASSFIEVDVGCNGTMTWTRQAIDKGILKSIPGESFNNCGTYSPSRITENIGAYKAQALFSLCGKVLRINPENGDGYPSNPFYIGSGSDLREAQNRIYALGFRQAFRLSVRPNTGDANPANGNPGVLYVGDVGFSYWEEVDVVSAPGQNFGWPYYEGQEKGREGYWKTRVFEPANPIKPRIQYRENRNTQIIQGNAVVSSDKRPLEGNCIIGGAWHGGGGNYPKEFQDTYYFADYGSGWIAGAKFGHDENPESNSLFKMASKMTVTEGSDRIVGMAFNPYDRNMYYVTLGEKSLVRQLAFTTNQPPTAVISKDKEFGNSPVTVNFSAKDSYDPEGSALSYEWTFGDGSSVARTQTPPAKTFTANGPRTFMVTLKVTDAQGKSNTVQTPISINNTPPTIQSTSVDGYNQISLPQTINLDASATDAQTPADQLKYQWTVYLYHNDHRHAISIINGRTGTVNLTEGTCDGEASYWYGMVLDVTDGNGLTTSYTKFIYLSCGGQQQTISFEPIPDKAPTAPAFRPAVSASSGLPVTLFSVDGPATIENGQVKLTGGIGRVTIRATQHGNGQFKYAQPVERSFMVTNNVPSTPDTQAPTAPTGLTASNVMQTSLQLNWKAATDNVGVAGYDVYQGGTKINPNLISGTTFAVAGLTPNTTYSFIVVARDAALNTSANSNTVLAKTLEAPAGNQPPVAPTVSALSATVNTAYTSPQLPAFTDSDPLTYTITGLPTGLSFNASTRVISGTPTQQGSFPLIYSASDGQLKTDLSVTLTIATGGGPVVTGNFEGYLDVVNCGIISGWVWDRNKPNAPVTVEFLAATGPNSTLASATVFGTVSADVFRQDLQSAGKGNGAHGYSFIVPESIKTNQEQTIWGRVAGSTYILSWSPKKLTCEGTGTPPVNQPPVPPSVFSLSASVNASFTSAPLAAFTDPENTALTYALTGLPAGLSFNASNRIISGTPTVTGTFSLTYAATDQPGARSTVVFPLVVNPATTPVNQPPVAPGSMAPLSATVNVGFTASALPVFTDAENDVLTYTLTGLPAGLSFNASTRVISGTPTSSGTFTLTYAAKDASHAPVSTSFNLMVATGGGNPVVTGNFDGYLDGVNCSTLSGWIWDRDKPNTPIAIEFLDGATIETAVSIGSVVADVFRQDLKNAGKGNGAHGYSYFTPESIKNNQEHTIWARVQGSTYILKWSPKKLTCEGAGNPPVNAAPVAPGSMAPLSATVNVGFTATALPVFTDAENDALTYTLTGLPAGLSFNASTRVIAGTPTASGTFTLTYAAKDASHAPVSTFLTLTVSNGTTTPPANQPPVAPTVSALAATVNVAYTSAALPVFTDANSDALTYTLTGLPTGLSFNASTRVISGTPAASGSFNLTYSASDGQAKTDLTVTLNVATGGLAPAANFDGYLTQEANCNSLSGWAFDRTSVNRAVTIEFFDGPSINAGTPLGSMVANGFRQHLKDAGKGNGEHWFDFPIPESIKNGQNHTIWARVQGSEFVLKWAPKIINCAGTGTPPPGGNAVPIAPASIAPLSATVNVGFTATALPVFTDAENDALTYTLTGLPAGLSFNASTRVIAGTPTNSGTFTLTYAAKDASHAPVSTFLTLTVSNGTTTPPPTSGGNGPGNYEGYLDVVECGSIQGWIWDRDRPNTPITVEFVDGNTVIGRIDATIFRQDLQSAGKGNGIHGYAFEVPTSLRDGQAHSISGRVPGSNYILQWSPKTLTCPSGSRQGLSESAEVSMELSVSPNPSRGRVEIKYRVRAGQRADLQVIDLNGRSIWQKAATGTGRVESETVDLNTGSATVYLIQLQTAQQIVTRRLLLNR
ncbi:putative Ig domain-containing protein [Larkinella insperata]|uniref:Ig domain-containing protein n=1 Tax=Larkinella insperata TaxID=332158 RepID=A0ABW3QDX3_9BACT|nr:putative Ig domain-containing protein [Larkinella insperata]